MNNRNIQFFLRPSSIYILLIFLCTIFILIFYDGYRMIYFYANKYIGANPQIETSVHIERGRKFVYDGFVGKVEFLQDRTTMGDGRSLDKRHKLRWLYKSVEAEVYKSVAKKSLRVALYVQYLHYSLVILVGFVFTALVVRHLRGGIDFNLLAILAIVVYAWIALVSTAYRIHDQHTFIEMSVVAAGLYFSLKRQLFAVLVILFIGVANRESGVAIGAIYAIINWREKGFWLPVIFGPILLLGINMDLFLLPDFWNPSSYVVTGDKKLGYINIMNLTQVSFSLLAFTALKEFTFFAPVALLVPKAVKSALGMKLVLIGSMYVAIFMFGTILGYLFPYAILIPIVCGMWAVAYPVVPPERTLPVER